MHVTPSMIWVCSACLKHVSYKTHNHTIRHKPALSSLFSFSFCAFTHVVLWQRSKITSHSCRDCEIYAHIQYNSITLYWIISFKNTGITLAASVWDDQAHWNREWLIGLRRQESEVLLGKHRHTQICISATYARSGSRGGLVKRKYLKTKLDSLAICLVVQMKCVEKSNKLS